MGTNERTVGFTIIETMLFLAVTGLLAVGILAGTGGAINQQRYRDSVNSLQSFLQDQYSKVTNVANDRDASWSCDDAATVSQADGQPRGTGECLLLGRIVTVDDIGKQLKVADVVGRRHADAKDMSNDKDELLTNYTLKLSPVNQETKDVAWGAMIVKPHTDTPQPTTLLIMRSPLSGSMLTFGSASTVNDPKVLITGGLLAKALPLCVASGGTVGGPALGVRVSAFAAAPSAVQVAPESDKLCA